MAPAPTVPRAPRRERAAGTDEAAAKLRAPRPLLGGLGPAAFMRRHWQKQPLLVRQAWPGVAPPLSRAALFALAGRDDVESRLVVRTPAPARGAPAGWQVRHGPLARRALPPLAQPGWTLLVQGLDLHVPAAQALLAPFAFLPAARLDDVMLSWASDGGGVGPHLDSYDVFLLQVQGRRRWRIGRAADDAFVPGLPLRILRRFEPEQEWVLEPGDMLYLPPRWAHDGVAEGECMTASIGFRAPAAGALAAELLQRLADAEDDAEDGAEADPEGADDAADGTHAARATAARALYRDPAQPATAHPGAVPPALQAFARRAVQRLLRRPQALEQALGEVLTEPKPQVWFRSAAAAQGDAAAARGVVLDAATRMLYDARHLYINGESYRAGGRDARLLQALADRRRLDAGARRALGADAQALLAQWVAAGWMHEVDR
jgi:50S ribosomal protein L16 3-hydroxylase